MYLYVSAIGLWASRINLRDAQEALCLVDLCREALKGFCLYYYRLNTRGFFFTTREFFCFGRFWRSVLLFTHCDHL